MIILQKCGRHRNHDGNQIYRAIKLLTVLSIKVIPLKHLMKMLIFFFIAWMLCTRANSQFAPNQWETALFCNDVSHWLSASLKSALCMVHHLVGKLFGTILCTKYCVSLAGGTITISELDRRNTNSLNSKHNMREFVLICTSELFIATTDWLWQLALWMRHNDCPGRWRCPDRRTCATNSNYI